MDPKVLPPKALAQGADFAFNRWFMQLPEGHTFEDLMQPTYLRHHVGKLRLWDVISVMAADGSFDLDVRVMSITNSSVSLRERPFFEGAFDAAALKKAAERARTPIRVQMVPTGKDGLPVVRVDHAEASGWRVLGLDRQPVSEGLADKAAADRAMHDYLRANNLELPKA